MHEHLFYSWEAGMGSLAGTCGIPTEQHRVYVGVECVVGASGDVRPYAIAWPDGRRFAVRSCSGAEEWGRWERGNVVRMWRVELAYNVWRELYWERGRFFVRRVDRNGEGRPLALALDALVDVRHHVEHG